ncbi:hypothetical protein LOAG_17721 [Loa loa]|nr:hypothetical protein LOAG_17721 [Loa loa]EJD75070.1 hypothetical protein LOAG_17721 [Loa loa]
MHLWTPGQVILFGREKPVNVITAASSRCRCRCSVLIFTSHEDHLVIEEEFVSANDPFQPDESPMNGVIIPYDLSLSSYDHCLSRFIDSALVIFDINRSKL